MPKFQIILTTVASITVTVEAEDEDTALDRAHDAGAEFANQYHSGADWVADVNGEWQFQEPEVKEVD